MKSDVNEIAAVRATEQATSKADPTIYTLNLYTQQEIFDFVVRRVIAQGVPATATGVARGRCVLLDALGNRCAIGMLVPGTEGLGEATLPAVVASVVGYPVLAHLRSAHDLASIYRGRRFVDVFREKAYGSALILGLDPACVYA